MPFKYEGHELKQHHITALEIIRDAEKDLTASEVEKAARDGVPAVSLNGAATLRVLCTWGLAEAVGSSWVRGNGRWRSGGHEVNTYEITEDGRAAIDSFTIWLQSEDAETAEAAGELAAGSITVKDRGELRRLLGRRKSVLQAQLQQREADITTLVRQQIDEQTSELCKKHNDMVAEFNVKARQLEEEWEAIKAAARDDGLVFQQDGYSSNAKCDATVDGGFKVKGTQRLVDLRLAQLRAERKQAGLDIEEQFMGLEEELILGSLTSEDGRKFLERVPTADAFLPPLDEAATMLEQARPLALSSAAGEDD